MAISCTERRGQAIIRTAAYANVLNKSSTSSGHCLHLGFPCGFEEGKASMLFRWVLWFCVVLLPVGGVYAQGGSSLFVDRDLKWEAGPPDLGYQTAVGTVTFFRSNGDVLRLSCELNRDSDKSPLAVELKSGYTVKIGRWRLLDSGRLEVTLRLVAAEKVATPDNIPQAVPSDKKTDVWTIVDGRSPLNASGLITAQGEQDYISSLKNRIDFDRLVKRYLR